MIALLKSGEYYFNTQYSKNDINIFLVDYAEYIGLDVKIFEILVFSNKLSTEELVEYINKNCGDWEQEIVNIYELGSLIC